MLREIANKILPAVVIKVIKQFFNSKGFQRVVSVKEKLMFPIMKFCSKNGVLCAIYYLFDSSFNREMKAALNGRVKHFGEIYSKKGNLYQLKRNVHRIEKGLIMKPRRSVFGLEYIEETIRNFNILNKESEAGSSPDEGTLSWAADVLSQYFSVVDKENALVNKSFDLFEVRKKASSIGKIPFQRDLSKSTVSFDQFYNLTVRRRSVRWYSQRPVPRELIDQALLAGNQSPSACNRQPYRYIIYDNPTDISYLGKLPGGTTGFAQNIQCLSVLVGDLSAYFSERDRHAIYIDASLSAMSFILALETLGLSSCCINWPDIERQEKKMDNFLKLKLQERPIMLISIGYPDESGMVPFSQKKSLQNLRQYESN